MLGMSLFNFGTIWSKQKGGALPRKSKSIRKQTQEQVGSEVQGMETIAEEEATAVISEAMRQEETQQQQQREQMTFSQKVIRYGAIGVWTISAGIIFTSVVFNQPFGLGKGMLSLLPGEPHMATLYLSAQQNKEYFEIGDAIKVQVNLDSDEDEVDYVKIVAEYDPEMIDFKTHRIINDAFGLVEEKRIDQKKGTLEFSLRSSIPAAIKENQGILSFDFEGVRSGQTQVSLNQTASLVLKNTKEEKLANILGKVVPVKLNITERFAIQARCQDVSGLNELDAAEWESLSKGLPLPQGENNWIEIDQSAVFRCVYLSDGSLGLLISSETEIKEIEFYAGSSKESKNQNEFERIWKEGERHMYAVIIPTKQEHKDVSLIIKGEKLEQKKWPSGGAAELIKE